MWIRKDGGSVVLGTFDSNVVRWKLVCELQGFVRCASRRYCRVGSNLLNII